MTTADLIDELRFAEFYLQTIQDRQANFIILIPSNHGTKFMRISSAVRRLKERRMQWEKENLDKGE